VVLVVGSRVIGLALYISVILAGLGDAARTLVWPVCWSAVDASAAYPGQVHCVFEIVHGFQGAVGGLDNVRGLH